MEQQLERLAGGHGAAEARTRHAGRATAWRFLRPVVQHSVLIAVALLFIVPIYWMVISGLKSSEEIFTRPLVWWPSVWVWSNITDLLNAPDFPFPRLLWNSTYYAGSATIGTVLSSSVIAYGFARLRFRGRDLLFAVTLATMMVPQIVTFIPTYVLFKYLGLIGTYAPLIVPAFFGAPPVAGAFFIFLLRQFFMGLPWELSDAAKVDGAGEWRIFWQIMLPLVRSALIVTAVFTFVWTWQDFLGPLIYLSDPNQLPLSVGLFAFKSQRLSDWPLFMAASTLTTIPLVVLFFFTQRYFLQGITLTGLKG
jgi:multiple sugar transport system permease protein